MALPTITLPDFPLLTDFLGTLLQQVPFEVPTLLHPPLVHFAIALPVIIVLLELFNLFAKMTSTPEVPRGKTLSSLSLLMIILLFIVSIGAYATGVADAKNGWDLLSDAARADIRTHKLLGAYLVLGSAILVLFKFISLIGNKSRFFFFLLTIAFTMGSLQQGKQGGTLVYEHGANVAKVTEVMNELDDVTEELDELEETQSNLDGNVTELSDAKTALQERMTTLTQEKITLQEEKNTLEERVKKLQEESQKAIDTAKAEATTAIESAKTEASALVESIKAEANKTMVAAKKVVEDAKKQLIAESTPAVVDANSTDTNSTDTNTTI